MKSYRLWVSIALIAFVLGESAYLLWRENYFTPELEKRTQTLEAQLSALKAGIVSTENLEKVDVDKLVTQSQSGSPGSEEGKAANKPSNVVTPQSKLPAKEGKININTASAAELDKLPGIGPAYANRIVQYREQNGSFKSPEDIKKIKGIGDSTFNKIKELISI